MTRKTILYGLAALVLCAPGLAGAQGKEDAKSGGAAMDQEAMMKKMAEYATPGPNHKLLEKFVGNWTYTNKLWMDPSAPPMESKGTANCQMILGGRYLQQNYSGQFMGAPFEGLGLTAFDNAKKMFLTTWTDNTGTGMMNMSGTAGADGDIVLNGTMYDPMMGKDSKFREVLHWSNPDTFTLEMFDGSGPKEMKMMEITHTRVK